MGDLIWPAVNFSIFAGIMVYLLRKPIKEYVSTRHLTIRTEIDEVRKLLRDSQNQFDDFSSKLKTAEGEIDNLKKESAARANELKSQLIDNAKESSRQIVEDSKSAITAGVSDLKEELRVEFAEEVIQSAEEMLRKRLTGDDQVRIRREFSNKMRSTPGK